ncbi:MAG: PQQ-binding-like beta-propeller repeat protein, partial [Pirellula sp.]
MTVQKSSGRHCRSCAITLLWLCSFFLGAAIGQSPSNDPGITTQATLQDKLSKGVQFEFGNERFRPTESVSQLLLSPDERHVVSLDDSISIWDSQSGDQRWSISLSESEMGNRGNAAYGHRPLVFSKKTGALLSYGDRGILLEWDLDRRRSNSIDIESNGTIPFAHSTCRSIDISNDDRWIAIGNSSGVSVLDRAGKELWSVENRPHEREGRYLKEDRLAFDGVNALVRFSPLSDSLAISLSENPKEIAILNPKDGKEIQRLKLKGALVRMDYSPDGLTVVATERDSAIRLYRIANGEPIWEYRPNLSNPYENYLSDVTFSPDGNRIVACATDYDLYLTDAKTGENISRMSGHVW